MAFITTASYKTYRNIGLGLLGALLVVGVFSFGSLSVRAQDADPVTEPAIEEPAAEPTEPTTEPVIEEDTSPTPPADTDGDGVADDTDNCVDTTNADQADADSDGDGDACDDTEDESGNDEGEDAQSLRISLPKVDICHATDSGENPYIFQNPSKVSVLTSHQFHNGPVWYSGIEEDWGDIIPPFDHIGGSYPGKNWDEEGQEIYRNGCEVPKEPDTVTLHAQKIVCDDESDLPNWGDGQDITITSNTANRWLNANAGNGCHLADWQFQWVDNAVEGGNSNPGDQTGVAPTPWSEPFTGSVGVDASNMNRIWLREVFDADYIPFTGANTTQDVSAELYCGPDVLNYDNWEFIDKPDGGWADDYYCVAWNVLKEAEACRVTVVTEVGDEGVGNGNAVAAWIHSGWTHVLEDVATWIWDTYEVVPGNMLVDEAKTFTKDFYVDGPVDDAMLTLAADNRYWVEINATPVISNTGEFNYAAVTGPTDVTSFVHTGWNTITLKVENMANGSTDPHANPAAGIYELIVNGSAQDDCKEPPTEETSDVTICKYENSLDGHLLPDWDVSLDPWVIDTLTANIAVDNDHFSGTTDEDGCVTFKGVPYGPYRLDEIMKDGWDNVSGAGSQVDVDEPEETFNLVNAHECNPNQNLLTNGGFETPDVTAGGWSIFPSGTLLLEWLTGTEGVEIQDHVAGSPFDGEQFAELDPNHPTSIWQSVATTPGNTYRLETQYSPRPGRDAEDNRFEIRKDGVALGASIARSGVANSDTDWSYESRTFVADANTTDVGFAETGTDTSYGAYLDNAGLYCVPQEEEHHNHVTICKAEVNDEPNENNPGLPGWTVMLLGDKVGDTLNVLPDGVDVLSEVLASGAPYAFIASGSYVYRPGNEGDISDAAFTKRSYTGDPIDPTGQPYEPWYDVNLLPAPYDWAQGYLGITVDDAVAPGTDWGTIFNSLHTYALGYTGTGAEAKFKILDDNYGDNSGSLNVDVYNGYVGITGENGCVTFDDVALGQYTVGEIMQDGWSYFSGAGDGQVWNIDSDQGVYTFNLINQRTDGDDDECLIEGYKYDEEGQPLEGWTIGLEQYPNYNIVSRFSIEEDKDGIALPDGHTLVGSDETDADGYYCVQGELPEEGDWNFRGFEVLDQAGWSPDHAVVGTEDSSTLTEDDGLAFTHLFNDNENWPDTIDFYNSEDDGGGEQCVDEEHGWTDTMVDTEQGTLKNGSPITNPDRTDPNKALGAADWVPNTGTNFYSLGKDGWIILSFDKFVPDVNGDDLSVHEGTNGQYPEEKAKVEVSQDGSTWYTLTEEASNLNPGNVSYLDFSETGLAWIKFVRITDTTNYALHANDADGFDLDAVDATQELCKEPEGDSCLVEGHKYNDLNSDGNWDESEPGLAGWTIGLNGNYNTLKSLVYDDSDENFIGSDVTDANGYYCIEGQVEGPGSNYEVYEVLQPGWDNTGVEVNENPVTPWTESDKVLASIGYLGDGIHVDFFNTDDAGSITIDKVVAGENANTSLLFNFDLGWLDQDIDASLTADDAPETFSGLSAGEYTITEIMSAEDDWYLTGISCDGEVEYISNLENGSVVIGLADDQDVTCTFTNTYRPGDDGGGNDDGEVRGFKWNDLNNDGEWDEGEPGLAGWDIQLLGEGSPLASDVTDETGSYSITYSDGNYTLCEVQQGGWTQTWPTENNGCYDITITAGQTLVGQTFGNHQDSNDGGDDTSGDDDDDDGGGSNTTSTGSRRHSSSSNGEVLGEVLGEQTSILPIGAPNTGFGGMARLQCLL